MLAAEPAKAHPFLDGLRQPPGTWRFLGAVGPYIDIIVSATTWGCRPARVSPRMYREFFKPRHKLMWKRAKELADVKVMLHCCGGVRELLPDLIDAGLDAINPVQITCRGMEPASSRPNSARTHLLGRRLRHARFLSSGRRSRSPSTSAAGRILPRRRLRLPAGAQHHGRCPAGEHRRHVRRGERFSMRLYIGRRRCGTQAYKVMLKIPYHEGVAFEPSPQE